MNTDIPLGNSSESLRLYVFDCGWIGGLTAKEFGFDEGELRGQMFTPCFLVVHPRGTLMWDTGQIPDDNLNPDGSPTTDRSFTVTKSLVPQLASVGYAPSDITYLALSHYHNDHTANANLFAASTWIVQRIERDIMFADKADTKQNGPIEPNLSFFSALENSKTVLLDHEDFDVFGDGTVVIKFSPGHTPGHQSLFLRLPKTGPLILTGDLYHHPEEMYQEAKFVNHANLDQTTLTRRAMEDFARKEKAQMWIHHDAINGVALKKAPAYYN